MTLEHQIVYVYGQIALMNAEIAAMQAENAIRQHRTEAPAYSGQAFFDVMKRYECVIGHNAVVGMLHR